MNLGVICIVLFAFLNCTKEKNIGFFGVSRGGGGGGGRGGQGLGPGGERGRGTEHSCEFGCCLRRF